MWVDSSWNKEWPCLRVARLTKIGCSVAVSGRRSRFCGPTSKQHINLPECLSSRVEPDLCFRNSPEESDDLPRRQKPDKKTAPRCFQLFVFDRVVRVTCKSNCCFNGETIKCKTLWRQGSTHKSGAAMNVLIWWYYRHCLRGRQNLLEINCQIHDVVHITRNKDCGCRSTNSWVN